MSRSWRKWVLCWLAMSVFPACLEAGRETDGETGSQQSALNGAPSLAGNFTSDGAKRGADHGPKPLIQASRVAACFQLNNDQTFFINATLDVTTSPYTILGGNISGTICDAPNWTLTGGTVGSSITINGRHTGTAPCASTVTIVAPFGPPAGYTGTYGFDGASTSFAHSTLFLGFNRSCP